MYSFRPGPEPVEREALLLALGQLLGEQADEAPSAYRSEWRQIVLEEGVSSSDENEPGS
jgi:hypothetical protein